MMPSAAGDRAKIKNRDTTRHHTSSSPLLVNDFNDMWEGVNPLLNDKRSKKNNAVIATPSKKRKSSFSKCFLTPKLIGKHLRFSFLRSKSTAKDAECHSIASDINEPVSIV